MPTLYFRKQQKIITYKALQPSSSSLTRHRHFKTSTWKHHRSWNLIEMLKLCLLPRSNTAETTKPVGQLFPFGQVCAERAIRARGREQRCAHGSARSLHHPGHPRQLPPWWCWLGRAVPLLWGQTQNVVRKRNRCILFQILKRFTNERLGFLPKRCVPIKGPRSVLALKLPFHTFYSPPRCLFSG